MNLANLYYLFSAPKITTSSIACLLLTTLLIGCSADEPSIKVENVKMTTDSTNDVNALVAADQSPEEHLPSSMQAPAHLVLTGKQVYEQACFACHSTGVSGAPIYGDSATWSARAEQDIEILYDRSINGYSGQLGYMPPKGGFNKLSIEEVLAAVDYMLEGI